MSINTITAQTNIRDAIRGPTLGSSVLLCFQTLRILLSSKYLSRSNPPLMWITSFPQARYLALGASRSSHGQTECLEEVKALDFSRNRRFVFILSSKSHFFSLIHELRKMWLQIGSFVGLRRIFVTYCNGSCSDTFHKILKYTIQILPVDCLPTFLCNEWNTRRMPADRCIWKHSWFCSDGFIYLDYRPPPSVGHLLFRRGIRTG